MTQIAEPVSTSFQRLTTYRRRPTKFTPERIEQIRSLVQQGTGREEIARLINVTVGSLQVTCSRLGISLRRSIGKGGRHPPSQGEEAAKGHHPATVARLAIVIRHNDTDRVTAADAPPRHDHPAGTGGASR